MSSATVYLRAGKIYVCSQFRKGHLLVAQDDVIVLDAADVQGIGDAVRAALAAYKEVESLRPRDPSEVWGLFTAAGVRSWPQFLKGTKNVYIRCDDGQIKMRPTRNEGGRKGFEFLIEQTRIVPETTGNLGEMVLLTFEDCE